ncbi:MAG: transposase [Lachnospiraceae bacterium]|nr:transposase [Lachnospiraceae bacterium]
MPKTKIYEPEFKKKIVRLYLEEGRTIKSLNKEYQLGDGTVRKWVRAFREECETNLN